MWSKEGSWRRLCLEKLGCVEKQVGGRAEGSAMPGRAEGSAMPAASTGSQPGQPLSARETVLPSSWSRVLDILVFVASK